MADATTTNYSFTQPEVGASQDSWGGKLNDNWASVDTELFGLQGQIDDILAVAFTPGAGIAITGDLDVGLTITADISTAANLRAGAANKLVDAASVYSAAAFVTLTDGASIAVDLDAGRNFRVTLGGNRELANPTNQKSGQAGVIIVKQDGTGGRTLSFGSHYIFPGGPIPLASGPNARNTIAYIVEENGLIYCGPASGYTT